MNHIIGYRGRINSLILKNKIYLHILKNILNFFGVPDNYYSINNYKEDAVCIECFLNQWTVYNAEKGNKYNIKLYDNIINACYDVISRLSESAQEKEKMIYMFNQKIEYKNISSKLIISILNKRINEYDEILNSHSNKNYSRKELDVISDKREKLLHYLDKLKDKKRNEMKYKI